METAKKGRLGPAGMTAAALAALALAALMLAALAPLVLLPATARAVDTLSTGAGRDARTAAHVSYSLKIVFAERTGAFVAGVLLKIVDESGRALVEEISGGPWFFADLPPGTYVVHARRNGARTKATVEVSGERQKKLYLTFPAEPRRGFGTRRRR